MQKKGIAIQMNLPNNIHPASFRDPAGFVFKNEALYYRYVSKRYQQHYEYANSHNVFKEAIEKKLLLSFEETDAVIINSIDHYKTLLPQQIDFITYPWEWSFEQLRDAAIVTLEICRIALKKGMILKDATPLNLQFVDGKFQWIDHLSFEIYQQGNAWVAYRQFCEMFLNPLIVASFTGMEAHRIMLAYPKGISAKQTAALLPFKSKWRLHIQLHVFLQAKMQDKQHKTIPRSQNFTAPKILRIIDSLQACIQSLQYKTASSVWGNYYDETIISQAYLNEKKEIIRNILQTIPYQSVLDAGCNDGEMAKLCNAQASIVAADADSTCIDHLHTQIKQNHIKNICPVVLDLTHPSGAMGWDNSEQNAFFLRKEYDLIFAFALIHHLAIGSNIPLDKIAEVFSKTGKQLLIEFVPKEDPKVASMLLNRTDIFVHYTRAGFEEAFCNYYTIIFSVKSNTTERMIYHMTRK